MANFTSIGSGMRLGPAEARRLRRSLALLVALGLLFLGWRVLSLGIADHLADSDPHAALHWRSNHGEALLAAALANPGKDPSRADEYARRALAAYPLQGVAWRVLAGHATKEAERAQLYAIAASRAPRDIPSLAWLSEHALATQDYGGALRQIDQMLRVEPRTLDPLFPALEYLASEPDARIQFAAMLDRLPAWRTSVLTRLAQRSDNPAAVAGLFEHLRTSANGLTENELRAWLERLFEAREWASAYLFWVSQLPEERRGTVGNVFDGGFERAPSNLGFDWRFSPIPGAWVERSATDGISGGSALRIAFDHQRVPFNHVSQLLFLPAGHYQLQGRARLESLQSSRGLVWSLTCAEGGATFASTPPFSGNRPWRAFDVDFDVPAENCGAQWLRLQLPARIPAEQYIGGTAWFDDLRILRTQ